MISKSDNEKIRQLKHFNEFEPYCGRQRESTHL